MKIQKIVLFSALLVAIACGKMIDQGDGGQGKYNEKSLQEATKTYCYMNSKQVLKEEPSALNVYFENLDQRSKVFAFSVAGAGPCAHEKDVSISINNGQAFFSLNLRGNRCLPNNSLWEVTSHVANNTKYYSLRNFEDRNFYLDMSATLGVHGFVARDNAGLQILTCQNP